MTSQNTTNGNTTNGADHDDNGVDGAGVESHVDLSHIDVNQFVITDIAAHAREIAHGNRVVVFDTTLRDGEQSPGATLNTQEKLDIAQQLARLGVDIMEAGFPAASPGDLDAVRQIANTVGRQPRIGRNGEVVAPPSIAGLARANKNDIDRAWEAVQGAVRPRIHTFLATSDIHMEHKLRMSRNDVLEAVGDTVQYARTLCADVEFSPEDAGRSDPEFLVQVLSVAIQAGATTLNIPDTVGYTTPEEFGGLIKYLRDNVPGAEDVIFSVHCHNDLGLATANTLTGLRNGGRQMEVTINGIGERAGNTSLEEAVMAIYVRQQQIGLETSIETREIHRASDMVSRYTGMVIQPNKAIVGANAFAHEAGIHQDGMLKNKRTYEIMDASTIGLNQSSLVLGKHSGRHALRRKLEEMGYHLDREELNDIFQRFKDLADKKKTVTDADLEALVGDEIYQPHETWELVEVQVQCGTTTIPTAVVKLRNNDTGEEIIDAGFGTGPVDAIYKGINRVVGVSNNLVEFLVQAITEGMDANGDVTIRIEVPASSVGYKETAKGDNAAASSAGAGVDTDIVVASARAYMQALNKALASKEDSGMASALNIAEGATKDSLVNVAEYKQMIEYLRLAEQSQYSYDAIKARFETEPAVSYGGNMAQWVPDYAYAHQLLLDSLAIHLPSHSQVLELGAGSGRVSQMLLDAFPDMKLTLVDISTNMLAAAEQRLQRDAERCCYVVQDIFDTDLEFPAASFDCIVSVFAICHARGIEVYQRLYERIHRWLKSPGYFVCYDHVLGDTIELTALNALGWHQLLVNNQSVEQAREAVISTYQEDSPLSLRQHLALLTSVGFSSADVLYKRDIFATYAAIKA